METSMSDETIELFIQHAMEREMDKVAEEFWQEVEAQAAKYEVTCDYYLAEFM